MHGPARSHLVVTVLLGLAVTGLIVAQAALLAHALAAAALGTGAAALAGTLVLLSGVVVARGAAAYGGEAAALRAAAKVKSQLRRRLIAHCLRLGPAWLGGQQPGQIAATATRGLDGLDPYFARYLPQLVLSVLVPAAVVATVTATDWISGLVIAVTLPLIPLFAALVGLHTKAQTRRQWRLLAQLGGHFLDVVQGLPTLKAFGRAKAQEQVIATVTEQHRSAAMATLRVAFLSALVLELSAALATALVAVETGLRLLYGHMPYQAALLVLLLTPEAYLPLRAVAAQYHASAEGGAAAESIFGILDTPLPATAPSGGPRAAGSRPALRHDQPGRGDGGLSRPRPPGPGPAQPEHRPGRTGRAHRAERGGEDHPAAAAAAIHRTHLGDRPRRRSRPGRRPRGPVARPDRLGPAAPVAVRRIGSRQHRPRPARRLPGRYRGRRPDGRRGSVHRIAPARL